MSGKYVLTKCYCWMVVSKDGLLKTPKNNWGDRFLSSGYPTKDEAVADYKRYIDNGWDCPYTMILVEQYSKDYVLD